MQRGRVIMLYISDYCKGSKLHSVCPTVDSVTHNRSTSRYDSVLINRIRIGHFHVAHSYLLSGDDRPTCTFFCSFTYSKTFYCNVRISVIYVKNISLSPLWRSFYTVLTIRLSLILSKRIFLINCNVCYLNFYISSKRWFYTFFLPFLSCCCCYLLHDFTTTTTSWHRIAYYVLMCR